LKLNKSRYFILILLIGFLSLSWNQVHDLVHPCSNLTEDLPATADHNMPFNPQAENDGDCGAHFCMWGTDVALAESHLIGQIDNTSILLLTPSDLPPDSPELDRIERPPKSFTA
jgi:hypothetical protein